MANSVALHPRKDKDSSEEKKKEKLKNKCNQDEEKKSKDVSGKKNRINNIKREV